MGVVVLVPLLVLLHEADVVPEGQGTVMVDDGIQIVLVREWGALAFDLGCFRSEERT